MEHRLHVIGLISGGKDSLWALCETRRLGHAIACLANLCPAPPGAATGGGGGGGGDDELDSFLIQTVGHSCVPAIAACMSPDSPGANEGIGVPLVRRATRGRAVCTSLDYAAAPSSAAPVATEDAGEAAATAAAAVAAEGADCDEVEDLCALLRECARRFPRANAVVCGAVLSHYQRLRVEAVCHRLGLQPLAWLWGRSQRGLLDDMVRGGVEAVVVKVAAFGLSSAMLGRSVASLQREFARLGDLVGLNECGEGGEYETITLDCPLFVRRRVALGSVRVVEAAGAARGGGAAHLVVLDCSTVEKAAHALCSEAAVTSDAEARCDSASLPAPAPTPAPAHAHAHAHEHDRAHAHAPEPSVTCASSQASGAPGYLSREHLPVEESAAWALGTFPLLSVDGAAAAGGAGGNGCGAIMYAGPYVDASAAGVEGLRAARLCFVSGVAVPRALPLLAGTDDRSDAGAVFDETRRALAILRRRLAGAGASLADVCFVHLFLDDMRSFEAANVAFAEAFGAGAGAGRHHPPARATVQARLRLRDASGALAGPLVVLDAVAVTGGGAAAAAGRAELRATLSVASRSHWAPQCIGPYCQANIVRRRLGEFEFVRGVAALQ